MMTMFLETIDMNMSFFLKAYCTEKQEDVESFLKEAGRSFRWVNNDLTVWYTRPVKKKHNATGEEQSIINQCYTSVIRHNLDQ